MEKLMNIGLTLGVMLMMAVGVAALLTVIINIVALIYNRLTR